MKKILLSLVVLNFFMACEVDFSRPGVLSVIPSNNATLVSSDASIVVQFSSRMDRVKTNSEFSLSGSGGRVAGIFFWDDGGKRLTFTPEENLTDPEKYTIRISGNAEDINGNDLEDEFISSFSISSENVSPNVVSFLPSADSIGNLPSSVIKIVFSEPVDLDSIFDGISISPSIPGRFQWNAGLIDSNTITFTPLYGFEYGTTYNVSINSVLKDVSGNSLKDTIEFNFTVGNDFIKPVLTVFQDNSMPLYLDENFIIHGAEKNGRIVLNFSEFILPENLRSSILITPATEYYVTFDNIMGYTRGYVNLTENLLSETCYALTVSTSVTDLQLNPLQKEYRFQFVTDGAGSIAPVVNNIGDLYPPLPPGLIYWVKDDIQLLTFNNPGDKIYDNIIVEFSSGFTGPVVEINPLTLSIYAETIAGSSANPQVISIDWPVNPPVIRFTRLKFGLDGVYAGNIYRILIKGGKNGLKDINGNYMKEDFVQLIRFPVD